MAKKALLDSYHLNEKVATIASHVLLAGMMVCLVNTVALLASRLVRGYSGQYLPFLGLLISLEAMLTWRRTKRWMELNTYGITYWVIEWIVLIIFIKIFLYAWHGFGQFITDLGKWPQFFLEAFFNPETVFVLVLAGFVWLWTGLNVVDLNELEGDYNALFSDDTGVILNERNSRRQHIVSRFFILGFLMVAITALLQIDFSNFSVSPIIRMRDFTNLVVYFLLGLTLISLTQLSVLRATWAWDQVPISTNVAKRWITFSLVFLALVSIVALVLPTSYSMGLLATLNYILSLIISVVSFLVMLIFMPILSLIGWLLTKLFGKAPTGSTINFQPPPTPPVIQQAGTSPAWFEAAKSIIFWVIFIGIVGYAFISYIRQNQDLLRKIRRLRGFTWLMKAWQWLRERIGGFSQQLTTTVKSTIERLGSRLRRSLPGGPISFINPNRLTPRQRVLFFYLALVRRGADSGLPRKPAQTPYEYARELQTGLSEVGQEVGDVTEAFIEARYSQHEIKNDLAEIVRTEWERIRRAIRSMRSK